jgi:hypothetical protein
MTMEATNVLSTRDAMLRADTAAVGARTYITRGCGADDPSVRQGTNFPKPLAHAPGMNTLRPITAGLRERHAPERSDYLIDGFRVSFLHQADWKCDCREFGVAGTCRHTREAGGMRAAQSLIRQRLAGF